MRAFLIIAIMFIFTNCLGAEISVDEKTLDTIESVFGSDDSDESETVEASEPTGERGGIFVDDPTTDDREYVSAFEMNHIYATCDEFPETIHMYMLDGTIWLDNERDELIAKSVLDERKDTFSFTVETYDQYDRPDDELHCTCTYTENPYYDDTIKCNCAGLEDRKCKLKYESFE